MKAAPPMIPPNSPVDSPPLVDVAIGVVLMIGLGADVTLVTAPSPAAVVDMDVSGMTLEIMVVMIVAGLEAVSSVDPVN